MDPATIAALSVGLASLVSIVAAGIVACCRKQINDAKKVDQSNSSDTLEITIDPSKKIEETFPDGRKVVTTELPGMMIRISMVDNGQDDTSAANSSNGYDKNTVPVINPTSSSSVTTTTAAVVSPSSASSSSTQPASSSNAAVAVAEQSVSHPSAVDSRFLSQARPAVDSKISIGMIEVTAEDRKIVFKGLTSADSTGATTHTEQITPVPSLQIHEEAHINNDNNEQDHTSNITLTGATIDHPTT
jgi:hypothetical protein